MNKDLDLVPEEYLLFVLDNKSANSGKDAKHTRQISRRMYFVSNGEKCKMHNIDWCEVGLKLLDIATNNVGENDLTPRMKYIMVRLDN